MSKCILLGSNPDILNKITQLLPTNLPFDIFLCFATPWTVTYQALWSMGFSRQEYWSGLPFHSPGDFPNPGIEPGSPALQTDALPSEPLGKPHEQNNLVQLRPVSMLSLFLEYLVAKLGPWTLILSLLIHKHCQNFYLFSFIFTF